MHRDAVSINTRCHASERAHDMDQESGEISIS